jgi:hypothetical protein
MLDFQAQLPNSCLEGYSKGMPMEKFSKLAAIAALASVLAVPAVASAAAPPTKDRGPCFFVSQWKSWNAVDDNTILLRVNRNDIYRVDVSGGANQLRSPGNYLLSKTHGNSVCSHLDLDLTAADNSSSFRIPLIARSLVKLTPEEVAKIPAKDLPSK